MTDRYITVRSVSSDEYIVSRSRFIGYAAPCDSEEKALAFLQSVREQHRNATHHCYAYVIGVNSGIMRYSDDGEPGGTAGLPIMDVLRNAGVVNCCVVVVRYFGGILLGTGGLVRAYTQGSKIALEAARLVCMELTSHDLCEVPYSCWDSVVHASRDLPVQIQNPEFAASVSFVLAVRASDRNRVLDTLRNVTSRRIEILPDSESYEPWEIS